MNDEDLMTAQPKWHREDNGSILLYTLKQDVWLGKPIMVNDLTIRIENANGSTHDLNAVADKLLTALRGKGDQGAVGDKIGSDAVARAARVDVDAIAYCLWSIHPRDVPDPVGMPDHYPGGARAWFYANEIRRVLGEASHEA